MRVRDDGKDSKQRAGGGGKKNHTIKTESKEKPNQLPGVESAL